MTSPFRLREQDLVPQSGKGSRTVSSTCLNFSIKTEDRNSRPRLLAAALRKVGRGGATCYSLYLKDLIKLGNSQFKVVVETAIPLWGIPRLLKLRDRLDCLMGVQDPYGKSLVFLKT